MKKATLCSVALLAMISLTGTVFADQHVRQTLDVWADFTKDGMYDQGPIGLAPGDTLTGSYWAAIGDLDGGLQSYGVEVRIDPILTNIASLEIINVASDPQWFLPETTGWDSGDGKAWAFDGRIGGLSGDVHLFDIEVKVGPGDRNAGDMSFASAADIFPGNAAFDGFVLADGTVLDGSLVYLPTILIYPEAQTWAMMLLGVGMIGFAVRRRQKS